MNPKKIGMIFVIACIWAFGGVPPWRSWRAWVWRTWYQPVKITSADQQEVRAATARYAELRLGLVRRPVEVHAEEVERGGLLACAWRVVGQVHCLYRASWPTAADGRWYSLSNVPVLRDVPLHALRERAEHRDADRDR